MDAPLRRAVETPLGHFTLTEAGGAITALRWGGDGADESALLDEAAAQLLAYAEGRLRVFDLPLAPEGGALQQVVMAAMRAIPFGETRTYGEIVACEERLVSTRR